jgi:hypothetical protein
MPRIASALLSLFLCSASALSAAEWMIPAAAHAPGAANTNWRTDVRLVNPSGAASSVRLDLLPQGTNNAARSRNVTVSVPAQGQLSIADVLQSQFAFTGSAALLVSSSEPSLIVTSRTYNQAASGATYGQFIPGVKTEDALTPGISGHFIYVTRTAEYRTNVGFAGTSANDGKVTIKLFDNHGGTLGSSTFDILPYGQLQVNDVFAATGSVPTAVAHAIVTSTVPVVAYASVIDNRTGDPVAMIAAKDSDASTRVAIPAVAHAAGAAGSLWRSDVRIYSPFGHDDHGSLLLTYYPGNTSNPVPVQRSISIGADEVLALDDVMASLFGLNDANGALRIESDTPIHVTSRTYNQSTNGTFGQDIPGVAYTNAMKASDTVVFSGLSDSGYRTNIGFFNVGAAPVDLALTLKRPDGSVIATKAFRLESDMMTQMNLFSFMGASGTAAASLSMTGSGNGSYVGYASVIDNASGDPVFVPAALSTAAPTTNPPPATGNCVTLPLMRAGLELGYRNSDGSYTSTQTVVSDSATRTVLQDKANVGGHAEQIDSTFDYVIQGEMRAVTHMLSKATVQAGPFAVVTNTDITFSPALVLGPLSNYCPGATFAIPATTQTVNVSGTVGLPTQVSSRPAATGEILAVRESLTTAAGTFSTVRYKSTQGATTSGVAYSISSYDIATGVLVRQQQFGASGNLVQSLDLVSIR